MNNYKYDMISPWETELQEVGRSLPGLECRKGLAEEGAFKLPLEEGGGDCQVELVAMCPRLMHCLEPG